MRLRNHGFIITEARLLGMVALLSAHLSDREQRIALYRSY